MLSLTTKLKLGNMPYQIKETLVLFCLGMLGVLTILTIPLPALPEQVTEQFSETVIRLLSMVQPAILLMLAAFSGAYLGKKVELKAPFIKSILTGSIDPGLLIKQLMSGIPLGFITGLLLAAMSSWILPYLPEHFNTLQEEMSIPLAARFLYGGITEEVIMRWGLMSFFVWIIWKITKQKSSWGYWLGIFITAFLFGLGHLPVVFISMEVVTSTLITYIICANMLFGLVAGWLFWRYGLESAMIAHVFAHVGMLLLGG